MEIRSRQVEIYVTEKGKQPFVEWLESLKDIRTRSVVKSRINRLRLGLLGDTKSVGQGVFELRIDFGPGYRVYFGQSGNQIVILLLGGDKGSQKRDINTAQEYWLDYRKRKDG